MRSVECGVLSFGRADRFAFELPFLPDSIYINSVGNDRLVKSKAVFPTIIFNFQLSIAASLLPDFQLSLYLRGRDT